MFYFRFEKFSLLVLYFSRFFLSGIPGQLLIILSIRRITLPRRVYLYLFFVICYWVVVLSIGSRIVGLKHLLFYFSFIPPLLLIFSVGEKVFIDFIKDKFLVLIFCYLLIESLLVNSSVIDYMYFFPIEGSSERVNFFGFYQRPLGVAGNASMSSVISIFALSLRDVLNKNSTNILKIKYTEDIGFFSNSKSFLSYQLFFTCLSVLLLMSGMGFGCLFLYIFILLIDKNNFTVKGSLSFSITLITLCTMAFLMTSELGLDKLSLNYFNLLVELKKDSFLAVYTDNVLNLTNLRIFFGGQIDTNVSSVFTSGDFGYLVTYEAIGVVGMFLVLATPLLFWSSLIIYWRPTVIFYASFLHYPGLLSPPGAVLFSLYLYLLYRCKIKKSGTRRKHLHNQIGR